MKKQILVTTLVAAFALSACTSKTRHNAPAGQGSKTVQVESITTNKNLTSSQKAEELAVAVEEMLTGNPAAFVYADTILDTALALDSNNKRAQMYKALLSPTLRMRGVWKRIEPVMKRDDQLYTDYLRVTEESKKRMSDALVKFLTDGQPDIQTDAQVQGYLDYLAAGYEDIRLFFKKNRDLKMTVQMFPSSIIHQKTRYMDEKVCDVKKKSNGDVEYVICTKDQIVKATLDTADNMAIEQIAAAQVVASTLYNAYNVGDAQSGIDAKKANPEIRGSEIYAILAQESSFGVLRNAQALKRITDMGLDGVKAVRHALANRSTFCPATKAFEYPVRIGYRYEYDGYGYGSLVHTPIQWSEYHTAKRTLSEWEFANQYTVIQSETKSRPMATFSNGVCIGESANHPTVDILATVEKALGGETITTNVTIRKAKWDWVPHETQGYYGRTTDYTYDFISPAVVREVKMKPSEFLNGKLKDLKTLKPTFNRCGNIVKVRDAKLAGILPDGDANDLLKEANVGCQDLAEQP